MSKLNRLKLLACKPCASPIISLNDEQGQSPFVRVIGAPLEVTSLHIATAVTCPAARIHPAVIAQAAATAAVQREGRFVLGVGSGEALNEHIFGDP